MDMAIQAIALRFFDTGVYPAPRVRWLVPFLLDTLATFNYYLSIYGFAKTHCVLRK